MDVIAEQHGLDGGQKPIVINVCSFPEANTPEKARLSLYDASTLFHELGHAMHGLLSKTTYPSQSGLFVLRDWVELPSQLLENWINTADGLVEHARHFETGQPMPRDLAEKAVAAMRFGQSFGKAAYLQSAILDMAIHGCGQDLPEKLADFSRQVLDQADASALIEPLHQLVHFSHLFGGGYAAGYYGYLWAEVLEADVFSLFQEKGLFDPESARRVHEGIYSQGDQQDPAELFEQLMGRKPDQGALMARLGVTPKKRSVQPG
jgi:peptidyl-dipeptidase Dcp